jgi:hypothetical protein
VDYSDKDAVLAWDPSSWLRSSSNSLCLDARTSAFALAVSVPSRSHVLRAEQPLKFTQHVSNLTKTGSAAAHCLAPSNS